MYSSEDKSNGQKVSMILYNYIHLFEIQNKFMQGYRKSYNREIIWSLKHLFYNHMLWNKFLESTFGIY